MINYHLSLSNEPSVICIVKIFDEFVEIPFNVPENVPFVIPPTAVAI
jgi:hypothetical protein